MMTTRPARFILISLLLALLATSLAAQEGALEPLDSDFEPNRIEWYQLDAEFGPLTDLPQGLRVGAVVKTLVNEFWSLLGTGYEQAAERFGVEVALRAAANESDPLGQLRIAEAMVFEGFNLLLVSPQSDTNLIPAMELASEQGVTFVNINDAVIADAAHYAGPNQYENGVRAARWFIENFPAGGQVAVIEGQPGVYAAFQRTDGFISTLSSEGSGFEVVASVPANWDPQLAQDSAATILADYPDLIGFYVNNDTMALGVVEAAKASERLESLAIIGTDGINAAYDSILAGELTGTVASFPVLMGEVSLEVGLRLLMGQDLPRVVATPQALITRDNYERYWGQNADQRAALLEDAGVTAP